MRRGQREGGVDEAVLGRVPAVHRIVVVRGEEHKLIGGVGEIELYRRRKAAQQRRDRERVDVDEAEALVRRAHVKHTRGADGGRLAFQLYRNVATVRADQAYG